MRILAIDIETRPVVAYVWRAYKENVSPDQVVDPGGVFSFAAKWVGEKGIEFRSDFHDGHTVMLQRAWELLDEADAVLTYNGKQFDIPWLQREFMEHVMMPPAPFKQIDLLDTCKKQARFFMNRLAHVTKQLGLKGKIEHEGFPLWVKCIEGDQAAWKKMKRYNMRDVTELEDLYYLVLPWITAHPSHAAHTGADVCPKCGGSHLQWRGYTITAQSKFRKFQCQGCGGWGRSTTVEDRATDRTHVVQLT